MKILITGSNKYTDEQFYKLKELQAEVEFLQNEKDEVKNAEIYDAVICNGLFLHNDIKRFVNLRYIQLTSAGFDRVPMDYVQERGIMIHNARGVYSVPMAEHAILKILELYKHSRLFYDNQKQHKWEKNRNIYELCGKNAVIVGFGNIGMEIAKRLKAFGVNIIGVDINRVYSEYIDEYVQIEDFHRALSMGDIVISTAPYTNETHHLFSEREFSSMKAKCIFINISRGSIVNEKDMIFALKNKRIYGAALDVFEEEPLNENSELWDLENVIITPHNSFVGDGNSERMFDVIVKNLRGWIKYG